MLRVYVLESKYKSSNPDYVTSGMYVTMLLHYSALYFDFIFYKIKSIKYQPEKTKVN